MYRARQLLSGDTQRRKNATGFWFPVRKHCPVCCFTVYFKVTKHEEGKGHLINYSYFFLLAILPSSLQSRGVFFLGGAYMCLYCCVPDVSVKVSCAVCSSTSRPACIVWTRGRKRDTFSFLFFFFERAYVKTEFLFSRGKRGKANDEGVGESCDPTCFVVSSYKAVCGISSFFFDFQIFPHTILYSFIIRFVCLFDHISMQKYYCKQASMHTREAWIYQQSMVHLGSFFLLFFFFNTCAFNSLDVYVKILFLY